MSTLSQFSGGGRIKSIQRGVISLSTTSGTATITAVDTTKSILYNLGVVDNGAYRDSAGTGSGSVLQIGLQLTNSTTITASVGSAFFTGFTSVVAYGSVSWQLVEYY
jgi:hypothetical protein